MSFHKQEAPSEALLQAPTLGTLDGDLGLLNLSLEQKKKGLELRSLELPVFLAPCHD